MKQLMLKKTPTVQCFIILYFSKVIHLKSLAAHMFHQKYYAQLAKSQRITWPNLFNLSNKQLAYQLSFKCQSFHCEESSLYLACSQYLTLKSLYSGTSRFFSLVNLTE